MILYADNTLDVIAKTTMFTYWFISIVWSDLKFERSTDLLLNLAIQDLQRVRWIST